MFGLELRDADVGLGANVARVLFGGRCQMLVVPGRSLILHGHLACCNS